MLTHSYSSIRLFRIILNIDADHLDYFKNLDNIKKSFNKFAHQTTGLLVINGDDENTLDAVKDVEIEKITYGFGENCDYRAENISADKGVHEQFDLYYKGEKLTQIKLIVPGKAQHFIMHLPLRLLHIILALLRRKFPRIFTSSAVFTEDLKFSAHLTELLLPMTLLIIPQNLPQHSMPQ